MERYESGTDQLMLEEFGGKNEVEVLDKHKVEESKREAFKGRGAPLEWRRVRGSKKYRIKEWRRRLLGKSLRLVQREYNLQRLQSKQEELAEEEEMKQQQRLRIMKD